MTDQTNDKRSHCPSSLATTCIPCKAPNWSWLWRHRGAVLNTATTCTSFMLFLACIRCLRRTSAISPIFHCTVYTIVHSCPETAAARVARKLQGLQGPLDQNVAKKMSCQFKKPQKPQSKTKSWLVTKTQKSYLCVGKRAFFTPGSCNCSYTVETWNWLCSTEAPNLTCRWFGGAHLAISPCLGGAIPPEVDLCHGRQAHIFFFLVPFAFLG